MDLESRLTNVFHTVFDDDSIMLSRSLTADDVDGWDSLSHVNLLLAIELEFGIEFKQYEVQSFNNVGELMDNIAKKAQL